MRVSSLCWLRGCVFARRWSGYTRSQKRGTTAQVCWLMYRPPSIMLACHCSAVCIRKTRHDLYIDTTEFPQAHRARNVASSAVALSHRTLAHRTSHGIAAVSLDSHKRAPVGTASSAVVLRGLTIVVPFFRTCRCPPTLDHGTGQCCGNLRYLHPAGADGHCCPGSHITGVTDAIQVRHDRGVSCG